MFDKEIKHINYVIENNIGNKPKRNKRLTLKNY